MRKLVFGINITLDGCVDHTKITGDEEVHEYFRKFLEQADTLLYGRKTYELMVPFWPDMARDKSGPTKAMNDFAQAFDAVKQIVVFSRSSYKPANAKTKVVNSGLREEVLKLKQQEGKNISVGGVDIPSQLMELDLIDEYHFLVLPVIVGEGRRLMDATKLAANLDLKLAETKVFKSGAVALRFVK